ncbi:MAG: hypothetical protein GXP54_05190 [Deltaproteobacteria bacterium]|nr:hypothetical protein [Deltaproteobacteria bacterium]
MRPRLRRLRPVLCGNLGTRSLTFKLHFSVLPDDLEIMDAFLNFRATDDLRVRAGIFKVPFSRYRIQSFQRLTLVDWAITSGYFGAERQVGFAFHNGYEKPAPIEYEVGVFTGQNTRASHAVKLSGIYGETAPNRSDLTGPDPYDGLHPEIVAHVAYNSGGIDTLTDTDFTGGPVRYSVGVSTAWDIRPERAQDLAFRLAPEFLLKAYGFSMSVFANLGLVQMGDGMDDTRPGLLGAQAQASYLIAGRYELAMRYAFLQVLDALRSDARDRADAIIAGVADPDEKSDLERRYSKAGDLKRRHELSVGINVYIIGNQLKWQSDFAWLPRTTASGTFNDIRFRTQVQLAF